MPDVPRQVMLPGRNLQEQIRLEIALDKWRQSHELIQDHRSQVVGSKEANYS